MPPQPLARRVRKIVIRGGERGRQLDAAIPVHLHSQTDIGELEIGEDTTQLGEHLRCRSCCVRLDGKDHAVQAELLTSGRSASNSVAASPSSDTAVSTVSVHIRRHRRQCAVEPGEGG